MFKLEQKRHKIEKKQSNKKRSRNSSLRSISNYQTFDKIPNDNLYNNDNYYSINKNFEFNESEEKAFRLFYHHHFQKLKIRELLLILYLRFFFAKINFFNDFFVLANLFNNKNLLHLISFLLTIYFTKEKFLKENKFYFFTFYIFFFNHCSHICTIYKTMNTKYEEFFILTSELIFNFLVFILLFGDIKELFFLQLIIQVVFFYTINKYQSLRNILSGVPGSILIILMFAILKKNIRERWALYDSFKRSYYNLNQGLLEKDPNPIFILSKDKNILYKNTSASKLINSILEKQASTMRVNKLNKDDRFNTLNITDIIHPNLKELFKKILTDAMEDNNLSSFNFPICKASLQQDLNLDIINIYDINNEKIYLNLKWYRILISKIEWKGKDSFYLCFLNGDDVLLNEIFYKYTERFTEKMDKMINNIDIICDALINQKEKEDIYESESSSIKSYNKDSEEEGGEIEEEEEIEDKNEILNNKKGVHDLLIENSSNKEFNNTILFFFKTKLN